MAFLPYFSSNVMAFLPKCVSVYFSVHLVCQMYLYEQYNVHNSNHYYVEQRMVLLLGVN